MAPRLVPCLCYSRVRPHPPPSSLTALSRGSWGEVGSAPAPTSRPWDGGGVGSIPTPIQDPEVNVGVPPPLYTHISHGPGVWVGLGAHPHPSQDAGQDSGVWVGAHPPLQVGWWGSRHHRGTPRLPKCCRPSASRRSVSRRSATLRAFRAGICVHVFGLAAGRNDAYISLAPSPFTTRLQFRLGAGYASVSQRAVGT